MAKDEMMRVGKKQPLKKKAKVAYHHGDLRSALMLTSLRLIQTHGVRGFNLTDATKAVGVSNSAAYRHFADREHLLAAIAEEGFTRFGDALELAYGQPGDDPFTRMEGMAIAYVMFACEHSSHFRVMFEDVVDRTVYPHLISAGQRGFSFLVRAAGAIAPDAPAENKHALVVSCWSLVHGFAELHTERRFDFLGSPLGITELVRQSVRMLLHRYRHP